MITISDREFSEVHNYIRLHYGVNLEKKKYLIESKLWIELAYSRSDTFGEYWKKLQSDPTGVMEQRMMDLLTTNYTFFCREKPHLDFLSQNVLPELPADRTREFKVWSAGCSTGQECYTIAMVLFDCCNSGRLHVPFSILGTDLSETAIAAAGKGVYGSADYARLPQSWQTLYCEKFQNGQFRVKPILHEVTHFQRQNLMSLPYMIPTYDVIFCRNVLIYFQNSERTLLIKKMTDALVPGGYMMIGHTESLLSIPNKLEYIQPAVYRKPEVTA